MRVALLAHDTFPERAKTAIGILRYGDHEVVALLDRTSTGSRVRDHVSNVQDAPVVASMADAPDCDALIVGVAPIGGGFDESWRPDVREALERGCDVIAGLHAFLAEDEEFARLAAEHDCELWDVRKPPDDLTVSRGVADEVPATVALTVGTDCGTGKMTTTMQLADAARDRGIDAAVVPTGQTGVIIENDGVVVDRVISDFAAGAVEEMVLERGEADLVLVEGQGSIVHPAYSGVTTSILHGSMPDALILCHTAGLEAIHQYEDTPVPHPSTYVDLYESLAAPVHESTIVGGALATYDIDDEAVARDEVAAYADAIGAPATDPVRFGTDELLDAVLDA